MPTPEQLASMPAMPAPADWETDFDRPTEFPGILIASFAVSFFFATLFLGLRLYTTVAIVRKFHVDDGLIILAWGCSLGYAYIMILSIDYGFGKHLWDVSAAAAADYLKILGPSMMTYSWSVSITKLAMLALYHRIDTKIFYRIAIYSTALGIFGYQIAFTYLFTGPCEPSNPDAQTCLNRGAIAQVVLNIAFDVFVILIPVPTIIRLKMSRKQKGILIMILGLGSGAAIVSAVKVSWVMKMTGNPDVTYVQGQATILSIWEANVSIWCNNLVRLKPFVREKLPQLYTLMNSTGTYSKNPSNPSKLRTWEHHRNDSEQELSGIRKGAMPLGSVPDLTHKQPGQITVTTDYSVEA